MFMHLNISEVHHAILLYSPGPETEEIMLLKRTVNNRELLLEEHLGLSVVSHGQEAKILKSSKQRSLPEIG